MGCTIWKPGGDQVHPRTDRCQASGATAGEGCLQASCWPHIDWEAGPSTPFLSQDEDLTCLSAISHLAWAHSQLPPCPPQVSPSPTLRTLHKPGGPGWESLLPSNLPGALLCFHGPVSHFRLRLSTDQQPCPPGAGGRQQLQETEGRVAHSESRVLLCLTGHQGHSCPVWAPGTEGVRVPCGHWGEREEEPPLSPGK